MRGFCGLFITGLCRSRGPQENEKDSDPPVQTNEAADDEKIVWFVLL